MDILFYTLAYNPILDFFVIVVAQTVPALAVESSFRWLCWPLDNFLLHLIAATHQGSNPAGSPQEECCLYPRICETVWHWMRPSPSLGFGFLQPKTNRQKRQYSLGDLKGALQHWYSMIFWCMNRCILSQQFPRTKAVLLLLLCLYSMLRWLDLLCPVVDVRSRLDPQGTPGRDWDGLAWQPHGRHVL